MEFRRSENSSMASLPIDIISTIFAKLPIKYLLRSKSVCKSWYNLITSSNFIKFHLHLNSISSSNQLLIFSTNHSLYSTIFNSPESPAINISFFNGLNVSDFAGSCNGLLLCICNNSETPNSDLFLVNPSTLQYRNIPNFKVPRNHLYVNYGFGYDFEADDYKIVRIINFVCGCEFNGSVFNAREVMVYSLRANSWKLIEQKICNFATLFSRKGALIKNHLIHWMFWCISMNKHQIMSFNLCNEKWIEVPMIEDTKLDVVDLGVLDGCLCLLTKILGTNFDNVDVWVMKKYGVKKSWVKLFNYSDLGVARCLKVVPISYCKNGREILLRREDESNSSIFWYDLREKKARSVEICNLPCYHGVSICIRSLVPLVPLVPLVGYGRIDEEHQQGG